jgi:ATP-binding cassette subfamily D (ALD) long-chain fatty acid import protein
MMSLADAGGRFMYSYKDLAELAGYTSRVYSLVSVLHSLRNNEFSMDEKNESPVSPSLDAVGGLDSPVYTPFSLHCIHGDIVYNSSEITFQNVPIVAPSRNPLKSGDLLLRKLNFSLMEGNHLFITGPNGAGKSAIARIISELWPVYGIFKGYILAISYTEINCRG